MKDYECKQYMGLFSSDSDDRETEPQVYIINSDSADREKESDKLHIYIPNITDRISWHYPTSGIPIKKLASDAKGNISKNRISNLDIKRPLQTYLHKDETPHYILENSSKGIKFEYESYDRKNIHITLYNDGYKGNRYLFTTDMRMLFIAGRPKNSDTGDNDVVLEFPYADISDITHSSGGFFSNATLEFKFNDKLRVSFPTSRDSDYVNIISEYIEYRKEEAGTTKKDVLFNRANELQSEADDLIKKEEYQSAIEFLDYSRGLYEKIQQKPSRGGEIDTQIVEEQINDIETKKEEVSSKLDQLLIDHLNVGETFSSRIDRINKFGNGIIETKESHIRIGPIDKDSVGKRVTVKMKRSQFAQCLTESVRPGPEKGADRPDNKQKSQSKTGKETNEQDNRGDTEFQQKVNSIRSGSSEASSNVEQGSKIEQEYESAYSARRQPSDEVDEQLETVNLNIEDAISAPFRDPESTRRQLIQAHKMTAELVENATESEHEDVLQSAERTLGEIETRLEALSEATDSLKSARSRVPPDEGPSDAMAITTLEAANKSYTSAIDIADGAGFDTEHLEDERADIRSRFEEQATRAKMIGVLQSLHSRLDRAPKANELPEECEYSQYDYHTEFGGWDEALEAAEIDREKSMLEEIERVAEKLGRVPSTVDIQEHGAYSSYSSHFGSWSEALEQADAEENIDSGSSSNEREAMIEVVRDLNERLERVPKTTELPKECEYSPSDFYSEFGSWDESLEAAGINKQRAMLEEIERVAEKLDCVPTSSDMDEHGTYSGSQYCSYFGSWSEAIERADVSESENRKEELLERLRSIRDDLNRIPKTTDLHDVSGVSQHDYIQKFGSWDEALKAAGVNKEQHLVNDLKQVAAEVDGKLKKTAVNRLGEYSTSMHQTYFGSWDAALEAADLLSADTAKRKKLETEEQYSGTTSIAPSAPLTEITSHVDGIGPETVRQIENAGYTTLGDLRNVEPSKLTKFIGIGQRRATKMTRFVTENVSSDSTSSGQSSDHRQSEDQPSSLSQGVNSNQIEPSALDTSWETIPANERIDEQFLIRVTDVDQQVGNRKTAQLDVQDQDGRKFKMNIWSKHDVNQKWSEREWYALENTRGKVWESNDGTTRKQLSSTRDVEVIKLGPDFNPNAASAEDTSETVSEPKKSSTTTDESVSRGPPDSTTSDRDTTEIADDEESDEDDGSEVSDDGVLDGIMSDFDEI